MTIKNGTAGADTLIGTSAADQLFGKGGNDILKGLAGPDLLDGGQNTDSADYSGSAGSVTVNLNTGLGSFGDAEGDTYTSIENVVGSSFGDFLIGNNLANKLEGGGGNDLLAGAGGSDTLLGGAGRDTVTYANSALGVNVNLSNGVATNGDAAGDTFTSIEDLIGSAGNDILAGTAKGNFLSGFLGADRLFGFDGNDGMFGGEGADTMTGGAGADRFEFDLVEHSPAGFFNRDVIQDFSHAQGDFLDLRFIDADAENGTGNDAFLFLGKDALIDAPGQISYSFENNTTVVEINTVGGFESAPEMQIQLQGNIDLVASDFIL